MAGLGLCLGCQFSLLYFRLTVSKNIFLFLFFLPVQLAYWPLLVFWPKLLLGLLSFSLLVMDIKLLLFNIGLEGRILTEPWPENWSSISRLISPDEAFPSVSTEPSTCRNVSTIGLTFPVPSDCNSWMSS